MAFKRFGFILPDNAHTWFTHAPYQVVRTGRGEHKLSTVMTPCFLITKQLSWARITTEVIRLKIAVFGEKGNTKY